MTELRDATIAQALCDVVGHSHAGREIERLLVYLGHPSEDTTARSGSDATQERTLVYARYGLVVRLTEQLAGQTPNHTEIHPTAHPADTWVLSRLDFELRSSVAASTSPQTNKLTQTRPWQTAAPFGLDAATETPASAKAKLSGDTYPQQFTLNSARSPDNRRSHFLPDGRVVEVSFSAQPLGIDAIAVAYMGGARQWAAN